MGTIEVFGALFVLACTAALAAWHMPRALEMIEAKARARREGLKRQREVYAAWLKQLEAER